MVEIKRSYFVEILLPCLLLKMVSIISAVAVIISRQTSGTPSCTVLLSCHTAILGPSHLGKLANRFKAFAQLPSFLWVTRTAGLGSRYSILLEHRVEAIEGLEVEGHRIRILPGSISDLQLCSSRLLNPHSPTTPSPPQNPYYASVSPSSSPHIHRPLHPLQLRLPRTNQIPHMPQIAYPSISFKLPPRKIPHLLAGREAGDLVCRA